MAELASKEDGKGDSKERYNYTHAIALWDLFGKYPVCISHTKEYVPYWQGKGVLADRPASLSIFDAGERQKMHRSMWEEVDAYISGSLSIKKFHETYKPDHATDIIEAMWSDSKKPFYINTYNSGAIANLPDDAFLELLCDVDMEGPIPRPVGNMPLGLRALQMQVIGTHELTVEAIVHQDETLLRRAMMTDPIVNSIQDGDAIIEELLKAERDALPVDWYM